MVACPGLPSLSWAATRRTQPRAEGCHSPIAQLIMSDLQTSMGDDILQMIIVCLRDGKEAVEQLKAIYPQADEAKNAELDITANLKYEAR
jgi:hypothetical protein